MMGEINRNRQGEVTALEISDILGSDPLVNNGFEELAHELKIPVVVVDKNIRPLFSSDIISSTMGFFRLLIHWIANNCRSITTVKHLIASLRNRGFVNAAEKISEKFSEEYIIVPDKANGETEIQERLMALNLHPYGVKILDIPLQGKPLVIYTSKILQLLKLAGSKEIVIISINGRQRSGKSFMLNQFQKYLHFGYNNPEVDWLSMKLKNPFKWGGSMERITSGIEVLSEPSFVNANGKEIAVFLMDTQGLFDNKTNTRDNILIFAFSLLLSSVTIFNDKVSSEDVLQFLQTFLDYARITAQEKGDKNQNYRFQKLIFLLRDWTHEDDFQWGYYDDEECPSGQIKNLMQHFLRTDDSTLTDEAVKTREDIVSSFQEISFFASPPPNCMSKVLDAENPSQWNEIFRKNVETFVTRTLSQDVLAKSVKSIGNLTQTGRSLSTYVEAWANIIQSPDDLPPFSTLLEATARSHYENIIAEMIANYQSDMETFIADNPKGSSGNDFALKHETAKGKCIQFFSECSNVGGDDAKMKHELKLQSALEKEKATFVQINDSNVQAELHRLTAEAHKLEAEIAEKAAVQQAQNNYNDAAANLNRAKTKLDSIRANPDAYNRVETHQVRRGNRFLGLKLKPTYYDSQRVVFDQGKFDAAVNEAQGEVSFWEDKVRAAEANLNTVGGKTESSNQPQNCSQT